MPYAVPVYVPFDASDTTQRAADQVICGFPFTCQAWPWPQDSNGGHMQPIAQIDLAKAGQTLGENLGDGLLQVWFPTDPASGNEGSWNPLVRVVPREALSDPLDGFYTSFSLVLLRGRTMPELKVSMYLCWKSWSNCTAHLVAEVRK